MELRKRSGVTFARFSGVTSYNVARRRNEMGIRMAPGAEQARVLRMALREVTMLLVAGLALGLAVAVFSTRLLTQLWARPAWFSRCRLSSPVFCRPGALQIWIQ